MKDTPIILLEENENRIFVKRDDFIPVSFGGNKARKALHFFKEIDEGGYDHIVTYGSSSSNHCRIIANMSKSRSLPCTIISPSEESEITFNSKLMEFFGAQIITVPVNQVSETIKKTLEGLSSQGKRPYFIAGGGHGNHGTQAYVECFEEILNFERENGCEFDYIFHASGTGTTQAGLVCGKLIHNKTTNIVGISIARRNPRGGQVVEDSVKEYLDAKKVTYSSEQITSNVSFDDSYICGGYGQTTAEIDSVITQVLCKYGIPMDSTYVGKAFCGMLQYIKKNDIQNKNILFIHTGGTPLFFDDLNRFTQE